ncbi:MAG TPA: hypothetical protein H9834_02110 [Candidatus Barnesiella excrementavium]|nr:hypothetical protein [Candidatus Barnesiella excrementavium]
MSGLSGIVGEVEQLEQVLRRMAEAQEHRGGEKPVGWVSSFVDARVGLMHNRRVTIESARAPGQPFEEVDTGLVVMLDGEIFNYTEVREHLSNYYRFTTEGVCEVVAKAYDRWGDNCFDRFEGYFAIVIYNRFSEELLLCRDRFGIKPLYYATHRGNLYFASEVRALFAAGLRPLLSAERWASYLAYSTYGSPYETFWEGVHQLPAGFLLHYNGYSLVERRWYEFESRVKAWSEESPERQTEAFLEQLHRSVGYSLMGDMTKGLSLDGGVESALFIALMKAVGCPRYLKSYMHYRGKLHQSSALWGAELLSETALPLEQVSITKAMLLKELDYLTRWQEEPVDGVDMVARSAFFRVMRKRGLAVVSGGWGLTHFLGDTPLPGDRYSSLVPSELLSADFRQLARKPHYRHLFKSENNQLKFCDLYYERLPHLLRSVDKMSMYYGVQIRNAFLNHNLIEIAFARSDGSPSGRNRRQWFARQIVEPLLPAQIRLAPEGEPGEPELTPDLKAWSDEVVFDLRYGRASAWFDHTRLEQEWQQGDEGLFADPMKVWKLLSLCLQLKNLP